MNNKLKLTAASIVGATVGYFMAPTGDVTVEPRTTTVIEHALEFVPVVETVETVVYVERSATPQPTQCAVVRWLK